MTAWTRVKESLGHRPWNVDLVSGVTLLMLGGFISADPHTIDAARAYDFLDGANFRLLGIIIVVWGTLQSVVTLLNFRWGRRIVAFGALWHWGAWAWGVHACDPDAYIAVLYAGMAFGNALTLTRL